ncbi:ATP-binding cassette domain-containing protein [Sphingomonas piscis]|uniref:ATP-binding cassette domain-containing protein n=1 Tax=Sphingomonas piscis TaxID=2714943 RepID=A0A6G7YNR3_9SPHN|nr:ATP-binding cassette domain-containing protein [Sphingomonas piscis]QIK78374.1 ATP-binding cassette domain-containing protein [Sphingomonas piscis]
MVEYDVSNTVPKGHRKQLTVTDGGGRGVFLTVPRFASVGKGDRISIDPEHPQNIYVVAADDPSQRIRIAPHFETSGSTKSGSLPFDFRLTEVNRPEDLEALGYLEQFHYKSFASVGDQLEAFSSEVRPKASSSGGRRAVVLLYIRLLGQWQAAGYIELQMPLMMCKPRHELFDRPFSHPERPVSWSQWDQHAMKKFVNIITRIGRIVIQPELRGLGLARLLIGAAKDYSTTRWQVGGRRPLFMEISAEMLNYIDFVSSCGFKYAGRTEGNYDRIVKDLSYMRKGYDVGSGIMSLQKKYVVALQSYCNETRKTFDEALLRLEFVLSHEDPIALLSAAEWAAFRRVLRSRIPYYICGLDKPAEAYLSHLGQETPLSRSKFAVAKARVDIASVAVKSVVRLPQTRNVRIIMDAFGLDAEVLESVVVPPTPVKASAGNIILLVGASGSGKSALLRALDPSPAPSDTFQVRLNGTRDYSCGWLKSLPERVPIFDYFAERYTPEKAFAALSQVGLSEAFVLVKPVELLSRGQQYRAMLADLLLREEQVWLLDEFCADLDPITARIVAHNLRKNVLAGGRIAFVAAANHAHFIEALRPTQVIQLRTGGEPRLTSYRSYYDELLEQAG